MSNLDNTDLRLGDTNDLVILAAWNLHGWKETRPGEGTETPNHHFSLL